MSHNSVESPTKIFLYTNNIHHGAALNVCIQKWDAKSNKIINYFPYENIISLVVTLF